MARRKSQFSCDTHNTYHDFCIGCILSNPKTLQGIDAANERAWNAELDPLSRSVSDRQPCYDERLALGFDMLNMSENDDDWE